MEEYYALDDNKISSTKINTLLQCPAKHQFQFVDKVKELSRSQLLRGISFHYAEFKNYEQKINSDIDLPTSDVMDIFGTQFDAGINETLWFSDEKPSAIKNSGYRMIEVYHKELAPKIYPKEVELTFELKLKNTDNVFCGRMDIIEKNDSIRDIKTKTSKPYFVDDSYKLQLTGYFAGFKLLHGYNPSGVSLDFVIDKLIPECITYDLTIEEKDIKFLLSAIGHYQDAITKGLDMPNRNSYLCNYRYCQYAKLCEKRYGGTVKGD